MSMPPQWSFICLFLSAGWFLCVSLYGKGVYRVVLGGKVEYYALRKGICFFPFLAMRINVNNIIA